MKINRVDTKDIKGDEMNIICFGDWHLGSLECNLKKINEQIEWIKQHKKNTRVVLMGDLMDIALRNSVGAGPYDNNMTPQEQVDTITEMLEPIKDVIIGAHTGNHEIRLYNETSVDIMKNICKGLGIPYLDSSALHHIRFGKNTYILYTTHGSTGSTSPAGKLGACTRLRDIAEADIYAMGHVHDLITYSQEYMKPSLKDKTLITRKRYFTTTGHYLSYGGYAQAKNYAPGKSGCAKIILNAKKWDVHISI